MIALSAFVGIIYSIDGRYEKSSSAQEYKTQQAQAEQTQEKRLYEFDLTQKQMRDLTRIQYLDGKISSRLEKYGKYERIPTDEMKKEYLEWQAERNILDKKIRKEVYDDK